MFYALLAWKLTMKASVDVRKHQTGITQREKHFPEVKLKDKTVFRAHPAEIYIISEHRGEQKWLWNNRRGIASQQISTNLNSSPFFIEFHRHTTPVKHVEQCLWFSREKRAKVNRKKMIIVLLILWRKKGCGSSNKHSVWICLLGSDDIQWHFNWILYWFKILSVFGKEKFCCKSLKRIFPFVMK